MANFAASLESFVSVYYGSYQVKLTPITAMNDPQKIYGDFSLTNLKKLRALLPKLRKLPEETRKLAQSKREKLEKALPHDFTWAALYELDVKELNIVSAAVMGLLEPLAQAAREGLNLNQFMLEEAIREAASDTTDEDYEGGHKGLFSMTDVFAIHYANMGMMFGLFYYGQYTNDLVAKAKQGDDDAFFKAIRVDSTILSCPSFAARLARARIFGEKNFMLRLHRATKSKPHEALLMHQDLRFILQLFHEAKVLPDLTLSARDVLFIRELKLYSDKGADPARSLMRFIQRWEAERPAT